MRKIISLALALVFAFSLGSASAAVSDANYSKPDDKIRQKSAISEKLKADGTLDSISKKRAEYYQKYEDKLIDTTKITSADDPESKKALEIIKESMKENAGETRGSNDISFDNFWSGDVILVHDGFCPYGYYRHGGTYDARKGKFISAQMSDQGYGSGVIWEPKSWYSDNYDEAVGLWNSTVSGNCSDMMDYLRDQLGEPYNLGGFDERDDWYCTKLPWVGYYDFFDINIHEWNFMMWMCYPDNIYDDGDMTVFASGS